MYTQFFFTNDNDSQCVVFIVFINCCLFRRFPRIDYMWCPRVRFIRSIDTDTDINSVPAV